MVGRPFWHTKSRHFFIFGGFHEFFWEYKGILKHLKCKIKLNIFLVKKFSGFFFKFFKKTFFSDSGLEAKFFFWKSYKIYEN